MKYPEVIVSTNPTSAEWRSPFGESGMLDFFLELLARENVDFQLKSQILRIIANACADTGASSVGFFHRCWLIMFGQMSIENELYLRIIFRP